jgi:hypothetical protein
MFLKTLKKKKNYFLFVLFTAFGTTLKVHCTKVLEKKIARKSKKYLNFKNNFSVLKLKPLIVITVYNISYSECSIAIDYYLI